MLYSLLLISVAQLIMFSTAMPQVGSADEDRYRNNYIDNQSAGPPADRAEIAGVFKSSYRVNDDDELLVIINEYKNEILVRQNACFRTHQKRVPKKIFMVRGCDALQ